MYCYYSKANHYENYHLMTRVLQNFDANLKRLLWNGFDESQHESDSHQISKSVTLHCKSNMHQAKNQKESKFSYKRQVFGNKSMQQSKNTVDMKTRVFKICSIVQKKELFVISYRTTKGQLLIFSLLIHISVGLK